MKSRTKQILIASLMIFMGIFVLSVPAFAVTSIEKGWIALDSNKKPISGGSQYVLSSKGVQPIKFITNATTVKAVSSQSVMYLNNKKAGKATALILGDKIPGFKDAFMTTFTIANPTPLNSAKISVAAQTYTGKALKPAVKVTLGSKTLNSKNDYNVSYSNNVNAGKATVTITGKGWYSGTAKTTFAINKINISKAKTSGVSDKSYTGKAITQKPTVTVGGTKLTLNKDYTLSYDHNTNVGKAHIRVSGKGNYTGTKDIYFQIKPDNSKPVISNGSVIMLDNWRYNFTILNVSVPGASYYKPSQVKWTITDTGGFSNVARFVSYFGKKAPKSTTGTGASINLMGLNYGSAVVTASLPNGQSCTCYVKVFTSARYKVPGDKSWRNSYKIYYQKKSISWGNDYVESYVNNAAWLVRTYGSNPKNTYAKEYAAKSFKVYRKKGLKITANHNTQLITKVSGGKATFPSRSHSGKWNKSTVVKDAGEICTRNGYVFLFTSKNQWGYLLQKDGSGKYKIRCAMKLSAGDCIDVYESYFIDMYYSQLGLTMDSKQYGCGWHNTWSTAHCDTSGVYGRPSSHGCTHIGKLKKSHMYYWLFVQAGLGTRFMNV